MKTKAHWKPIGLRPHHGILVPLASLRSKKSCGIGEFNELIPLIDWCHSLGLDVIQLLPLYDTGEDPSPYNALSSCALDPVYLSLADLPDLGDLADDLTLFAPLSKEQRTPWSEVKHQKLQWLTRYFLHRFEKVFLDSSYQTFLHNHPWVRPYALFKAYKDEHNGNNWREWPLEQQSPSFQAMEDKRDAVEFHSFLQYLCFQQMSGVHNYATKKNVFLKGDIPISLSPDSADVWENPSLFDLESAAGAPPDLYNPNGQWWGFPLFNWNAMRADHFAWWKRRFDAIAPLFHLYRIDHVVGYFRIWAIPPDKSPTEGHFVPSNQKKWLGQGREILNMMIDSSPLLPMAEDLGTIPKFVPTLLKELGICSTKVIRWQRDWEGDKHFIPYSEYEPLSLTALSTADSEPLVLWWQKLPDEARAFAAFKKWTYQPTLSHAHHLELLRDSHHTPSLFHINLLQDFLSLFPELVWSNPEDERINVPGTLLPTNWTYRFRPTIEEFTSHKKLFDAFKTIIY